MVSDLPDYSKYVVQQVSNNIYFEYPSKDFPTIPTMEQLRMFSGTSEKSEVTLTTDYLKRSPILPTHVVISDPTGAVVSYEGGWACRALIYKAGAGEVALAKNILDQFVNIQSADGSWAQQYYPTRLKDGKFAMFANAGEPYSWLSVDSGAALLAWAMADYDKAIGPGTNVVYKTAVQKAMSYLRECQYQHMIHHSTYLLANQRWDYGLATEKWNSSAFAADSAECLLAMLAALDQYGTALLTSNGYSIKTMANDIYTSLATVSFRGDPDPSSLDDAYFWTQYPYNSIPWLMPKDIVPEGISYAQALCAWAVYAWAKSAHLVPGTTDYSYICERALNWAIALTAGKWGGFYYHPIAAAYGAGITGDGYGLYDEFPAFTALMVLAMKTVNNTLYADRIDGAISFIRKASLSNGRVVNRVLIDGRIDLGEASVFGDGMHFRTLNIAHALLAGA